MRTDISISIFDLITFLGVFQGIFVSWFFIKNAKQERKANLYNGLLLLFLSLTIFEELLNNTGYIVQFLAISNFSEPLNFTFAPLVFLYVVTLLEPEKKRIYWPHFILAGFWCLYMIFHFVQPDEIKYNSYIETKHPDWGYLITNTQFSDDPLGVRRIINQLTIGQMAIYISLTIHVLLKKYKALNIRIFSNTNRNLSIVRNFLMHFILIVIIYLSTKLYYGMHSDIGGYLIASYISLVIFITSFQIINVSDFFNHPQSFFNFPPVKYQKSSLSNSDKETILNKINTEMIENKYFKNNLASLSGLAKQIGETTHHVSQVINEKLSMNFFETLAWFRVEEAKRILNQDSEAKITIEELSEMVGYNSKSSFNTAFKKITEQTPSQFRKNNP